MVELWFKSKTNSTVDLRYISENTVDLNWSVLWSQSTFEYIISLRSYVKFSLS